MSSELGVKYHGVSQLDFGYLLRCSLNMVRFPKIAILDQLLHIRRGNNHQHEALRNKQFHHNMVKLISRLVKLSNHGSDR